MPDAATIGYANPVAPRSIHSNLNLDATCPSDMPGFAIDSEILCAALLISHAFFINDISLGDFIILKISIYWLIDRKLGLCFFWWGGRLVNTWYGSWSLGATQFSRSDIGRTASTPLIFWASSNDVRKPSHNSSYGILGGRSKVIKWILNRWHTF